MVWNEAEFEAALEEADTLIDARPADGSAEHDRLLALLTDLASYRPNIFKASPEDAVATDRARLAQRLDAFEARVKPHYGRHWAALTGANWRYK